MAQKPAGDDPQVDRQPESPGTPAAASSSMAPAGTASPPDQSIGLRNLPWAITDEPPEDRALPPWFRRAVVLVLFLVVASRVLVWGFAALESFWYTLFFSFFLGLAMEPVVNSLAARGLRRGLATFLVMTGLLVGSFVFFAVFGNLLATQMAALIRSIPETLQSALDWVNSTFGTQFDVQAILEELGIETKDIAGAAASVGLGLLGVLGAAIGWVFSLFTVLLFSFYFAADGPRFRRTIAGWLTPEKQRTFLTVWDISTQKAGGYVISRGIMATISAAFHGAVFYLMDLPYWLPMAMWVGLVSQFIPTIGTYLAGALPVIIALVDGSPGLALAVVVAVTAYQQIENYIVSPRVTRSTLEIHPAVGFGSVIVGSTLFGPMGALLAIPVVATIQAIVTVYGKRYDLVSEFGTEEGASEADRMSAAMRAASDPRQPPSIRRAARH